MSENAIYVLTYVGSFSPTTLGNTPLTLMIIDVSNICPYCTFIGSIGLSFGFPLVTLMK